MGLDVNTRENGHSECVVGLFLSCFCRPELFDWSTVERKTSVIDKLEHAFNTAEQHLGIDRLLDPEGN